MKNSRISRVVSASVLALLFAALPTASAQGSTRNPECQAGCTQNYSPVCGDNNVLYSNDCYLRIDACEKPDTAGFNDPFPFSWPPGTNEDTDGSNSSSGDGSSDEDGDSDDPGYQLPPDVVIDDGVPSASGFVPVTPTPAPTTSAPVVIDGGEDVLGGTADVKVEESMRAELGDEWDEGDSSASSGSGDGDDDGDGDDHDTVLCEIMCLDVFDPVCASDNVTYGNRCKFAVAQCKDRSLEPAHMGECGSGTPPTPDPCAFDCPMFDAPVCSAEGHIYTNLCTYSSALCRDPSLSEAIAELCVQDQ